MSRLQSFVQSDFFHTTWNGFYQFCCCVYSGLVLSHSSLKAFSVLSETESFVIYVSSNWARRFSITFKSGDWDGVLITFGQLYKHYSLTKCEECEHKRVFFNDAIVKIKISHYWSCHALHTSTLLPPCLTARRLFFLSSSLSFLHT
jgi:hypothetical protein